MSKPNEAKATVCDVQGNLLFYTDGTTVWDRNHNVMPNGDLMSIVLPMPSNLYWLTQTNSTTQGALIVPIPGNSQRYYVFSLTSAELAPLAGRLYYSIIDMGLNGGLGDVATNKKAIIIDSNLTEKMTAVAAAKCGELWVMVRSAIANEYKAYMITDTGININPVISTCGTAPLTRYMTGAIKFSSDGKRMAAACSACCNSTTLLLIGIELYDFNVATGIVSNVVPLAAGEIEYYGLCFSPDGSKLYATKSGGVNTGLYQFNLSLPSNAIAASKILIGLASQPTQISRQGHIKTGPDGKMYITDGAPFLSVVNFPNLLDTACQLTKYSFPLSARTASLGLPNEIIINNVEIKTTVTEVILCKDSIELKTTPGV